MEFNSDTTNDISVPELTLLVRVMVLWDRMNLREGWLSIVAGQMEGGDAAEEGVGKWFMYELMSDVCVLMNGGVSESAVYFPKRNWLGWWIVVFHLL